VGVLLVRLVHLPLLGVGCFIEDYSGLRRLVDHPPKLLRREERSKMLLLQSLDNVGLKKESALDTFFKRAERQGVRTEAGL
jgi:hypothetical protein